MNKYKLGIIGCGNMASAIVRGIIESQAYSVEDIIMSDINKEQRDEVKNAYTVDVTSDNESLVSSSDTIILAVKPQVLEHLFTDTLKKLFRSRLLISIAAGVSVDRLRQMTVNSCRVIRVMPNTAAMIGMSVSAMCFAENVSEADKQIATKIFESIGSVSFIEEKLFDAVTAISGSSPAYVFMMMEAMADAAVSLGLARNDAYKMAAGAITGSAQLYLSTNKHPGELKDMVCSPAGTTIVAVKTLEEKGFRGALIDAMVACAERSAQLGGKEV